MAEKQKTEVQKPVTRPNEKNEEDLETIVRRVGYDIPGSKNIYAGLIRIKGISWALSNAICLHLNLPKSKKVSELSKDEIKKIEDFLRKLSTIPKFLQNRKLDIETGETNHYLGSSLDIKKEFDIKRLKEIKSYRGIRHSSKLPVRGQRTRSHFRNKGQTLGVKRKK